MPLLVTTNGHVHVKMKSSYISYRLEYQTVFSDNIQNWNDSIAIHVIRSVFVTQSSEILHQYEISSTANFYCSEFAEYFMSAHWNAEDCATSLK